MEINQRMSKRFAWLLGVVVLVSIGVLVACGTTYNASSDGLVLVGSQGSGLIETFSFNLGTGSVSAISNTPTDTSNQTCVLNGVPSSLVVDPKGTYAYAIINAVSTCPGGTTGLLAFKVNSSGSTNVVGSLVAFNPGTVTIQGTASTESVAVVPKTIVMDPAGKFLFAADRATTDGTGLPVPGSVSVFAIGSGGSVTEVAGSPFFTSNPATTLPQSGIDIASVAPTPTVFPAIGINGVQNSVCSAVGLNPPTSQYLYAVDGLGNQVFEFVVDTSSGVLKNPSNGSSVPSFSTDQIPAGVAVDPCDRFVYVSDSHTDKVSAYTICSAVASGCPLADGSLKQVAGSPFSLSGSASSPGPLVVDPFGNNVYVVGTLSNTVSPLKISPISGALTAMSPAMVATGQGPMSIAIRGDDNWMFVTNFGSALLGGSTVSQYAITPATGALTAQPAIPTDNLPWGVAVK
jgi:6-phosphogluconolactonase (cycloisomerase 2 family)